LRRGKIFCNNAKLFFSSGWRVGIKWRMQTIVPVFDGLSQRCICLKRAALFDESRAIAVPLFPNERKFPYEKLRSSRFRNFAVVGHASSGKTMLCEHARMRRRHQRMGRIAEGSRCRITTSAKRTGRFRSRHRCCTRRAGKKLNIIDTRVISISSVRDWARCASAILRWWWFTPNTGSAWAPTGCGLRDPVWHSEMIVVNGMDKEHVDFDAVVKQVRSDLAGMSSRECAGDPGRLQPRPGRVAQRGGDLRDRWQRQIQGGTGDRRMETQVKELHAS